jgi:hypothetical protein
MSSQGSRSDAVRMGTPAPGGLPLVDGFDERDLSIWRRWREPISKRGRLVELVPDAVVDVPLYWQVNRLAADRLAGRRRHRSRRRCRGRGCYLGQLTPRRLDNLAGQVAARRK